MDEKAMEKDQMNESTETSQSPTELLKQDHDKVKELFERFEQTEDTKQKGQIAQEAIMELKIHTSIEEEIFYPGFRQESQEEDLVDEAEEEHHVAKLLIAELEKMEPSDEKFEAKFKVLSEMVKHHIEEEEGEMFPKAEELELDDLSAEMMERKQELQQELSEEGGFGQKPRRGRKSSKSSGRKSSRSRRK